MQACVHMLHLYMITQYELVDRGLEKMLAAGGDHSDGDDVIVDANGDDAHDLGKKMLADMRNVTKSDALVATKVMAKKFLQVRMREQQDIAELFLARHNEYLRETRSPEGSLAAAALRATGGYTALCNDILALTASAFHMRRYGVHGLLPPSLADLVPQEEADRMWKLCILSAKEHAWAQEWYSNTLPEKFAHLVHPDLKQRAIGTVQVRNIWNVILAAEAISMDESHEMCEAVSKLLNKIQFNRLTLVREAFVEQQLSSGGAEEWSAHILKDMESWFSMLDNTFYTIERIFGDIQDTTRNCKAKTVSPHRCVLFVTLKLTTTNITYNANTFMVV